MQKNLLTTDEQQKVVESVIYNGQFQRIVPLAANGYYFSIMIFDMLINCNQEEVLLEVWNTNFAFRGAYKKLLQYVVDYMGETEAARFIAERREVSKSWAGCYGYFSPKMLEIVGDWNALLRLGEYQILASNGLYNLLIEHYGANLFEHDKRAIASALGKNCLDEIVSQQKFSLLLRPELQPEGLEWLLQNDKLDKAYAPYEQIQFLTVEKNTLLNDKKARAYLRQKGDYNLLCQGGHYEYAVADKKWQTLYQNNQPMLIDWYDWYSAEGKSVLSKLENIAERFDGKSSMPQIGRSMLQILSDFGDTAFLLKKGQLWLAIKSLF